MSDQRGDQAEPDLPTEAAVEHDFTTPEDADLTDDVGPDPVDPEQA